MAILCHFRCPTMGYDRKLHLISLKNRRAWASPSLGRADYPQDELTDGHFFGVYLIENSKLGRIKHKSSRLVKPFSRYLTLKIDIFSTLVGELRPKKSNFSKTAI